MATQSQIVDELVRETLRPDMLELISSFLNQVVRELHQENKGQSAVKFSSNLYEAELTADSDELFTWKYPRPALIQAIETVYYPVPGKTATLRYPSSVHAFLNEVNGQYYYYRTGDALAFNGYGGSGATIQLAWYEYPRRLVYQTAANRKVTWDDANQIWVYDASLTTDEMKDAALVQATNWVLYRHTELVKQGVRSKLHARLGQTDRARLAYSLYEQLRPGMVSAETAETGATYYR